jgi:HEAT repeat protein
MDLFERALAEDPDSDARWELVGQLRSRNDEDTYRRAVTFCGDPDSARRSLGVDVLAQLGAGRNDEDRPFRSPSVDLLLAMVEEETDVGVLVSIGHALGHLGDDRGIDALCRLAAHEHEDVRYAAACALGFSPDQRAIDTLVALSADEDSDVRDWATFGLGQNEVDSAQIREALAARLTDPDGDTREEAVAGLAMRGDERAIEPLLELMEEWEGRLLDESLLHLAVRTGDPRLRPAFEERMPELGQFSDPAFAAETATFDVPSLEAAAAALGIAPRTA